MKIFILLFALLFLHARIFSQLEKKSLLWEVKTKEGKTCSYLFGTIHAIDETKFYFPKKLEKIASKCDAICLEIAGISSNPPSIEKLMMTDKSLQDLFTKSQMDSIHYWAERFLLMKPNQFDENFGQAKPFLLLQFILKTSLPEDIKSYELVLEETAKKNNQELLGFETVDFQLSLFDQMTLDEQVRMVMESLRDEKNAKNKFEEMQQVYLEQDLDQLYKMTKDESTTLNRSFLEDRNIDWIPKIEEITKNKIVFIAVGAAHLAGPEGVIELLINKGFQVLPVKI
ncbi:MAG: TraB/GumN family protein [Crocinitomicaceae bacterium]|jgi:uncharacterized protein YbaP (TraB family)